ncbi:MAG: N-acetyltransferase, partial [Lachnospiraceae bacterium]|nr:N-acetyltransferase [Lachnospiraceae bacterium]
MITIKENQLDLDTYLNLRKAVNWKVLNTKQAETALNNSIYKVCAYDGDMPVGMGRIVGDGAVIAYIQDLVVIP